MPEHPITWTPKHDQGTADMYVQDGVMHRVLTVPMRKVQAVEAHMPELDRIILENTQQGQVDWKAVAAAFQASIDKLIP